MVHQSMLKTTVLMNWEPHDTNTGLSLCFSASIQEILIKGEELMCRFYI